MSQKSAIVIGGGVAGLAAGCYLRMNGYAARVLEMGHNAGGVSVSWKRGGYVFDGATNWLPGSSPSLNFHRILAELIDFGDLSISDPEEFEAIEGRNGTVFHVYTDADRLRDEMLRIAPQDRSTILEFTNAVKQVARQRLPIDKPSQLFSIGELIRIGLTSMPLLFFVLRWRPVTIRAYAQRFRNPDLRELFQKIFLHHGFFSVLGLMNSLGWMNLRSAGYPRGGSAAFIGCLQRRLATLGGEVEFGARVTKILVEGGRACGVMLADGATQRADVVISACDGRTTLFDMLGDSYVPAPIRRAYDSHKVFPSYLQVSLGVARTFDRVTHKMMLPLPQPLSFGEEHEVDYMIARFCTFDPTLAPPGKTAVVVHLRTRDFQYWVNLRAQDPARYAAEKKRAADTVIAALEARFGGIAARVEVVDVSTPATLIRYTGIWKGSYQGWAPTPEVIGRSLPRTLPGLAGYYQCGQWVDPPGGLPRVIISARMAVQTLCRDDRRPFQTTRAASARPAA